MRLCVKFFFFSFGIQILSFVCLKDYYAILEIPVTATIPEIKQAYRKLVMIHHPDKNNEHPYSLSQFNEIKEAYETLINPAKKERYLQKRWLQKAGSKKIGEEMITPPNILIQCLELNKVIADMDVHRMDHAGVAAEINQLLNDEVIEKLTAFNETDINQTIIEVLLNAAKSLPMKETKQVTERLFRLAQKENAGNEKIHHLLNVKKQQQLWDRYQMAGIIILTICICLLIWVAGKR